MSLQNLMSECEKKWPAEARDRKAMMACVLRIIASVGELSSVFGTEDDIDQHKANHGMIRVQNNLLRLASLFGLTAEEFLNMCIGDLRRQAKKAASTD